MLSPPTWKKFSSGPTRSSPSSTATRSQNQVSVDVRGATSSAGATGRRQRLAVELAVCRERQRVKPQQRRWRHVVRQTVVQPHAQFSVSACVGNEIAYKLATAAVGDQVNRRRRDAWMAQHLRLYLAQFDAEAAKLDLIVLPPEELYLAVGPVAAEIPGVVEALARDRMIKEAGCRFLGVEPITVSEARSGNKQLSGRMDRTGRQIGLKHVEALIRERPPIGNGYPVRFDPFDRVNDRPDRRLGRAAQADKPAIRPEHGSQSRRQRGRDPVAAQEHQPKARKLGLWRRARRQHQLDDHRHRVPQRDAVIPHQMDPGRRILRAINRRDDDGPACAQDTEYVEDGKIELERGHPKHPVALVDAEAQTEIGQRVDRRTVGDGDTLGGARAA